MRALKQFAAVAAVAASVALMAAPAHAAERDSVCNTGEVCLWADWNWTGAMLDTNYSTKYLGSVTMNDGYSANDRASSTKNYDNANTVYFYEHEGYAGGKMAEGPGSIRQNLASNSFSSGAGANDNIGSFCFSSNSGCPR
ncbi:peptidase inhibitor family I36 protein [Kitasatospora sp. NPDC091335]|uniref:peptidase inhibitor family I36 protein n=1 Tax=Kitasatospora sp. NPDC091335 TaxID=3364085 RepID=UPI0038028198